MTDKESALPLCDGHTGQLCACTVTGASSRIILFRADIIVAKPAVLARLGYRYFVFIHHTQLCLALREGEQGSVLRPSAFAASSSPTNQPSATLCANPPCLIHTPCTLTIKSQPCP